MSNSFTLENTSNQSTLAAELPQKSSAAVSRIDVNKDTLEEIGRLNGNTSRRKSKKIPENEWLDWPMC